MPRKDFALPVQKGGQSTGVGNPTLCPPWVWVGQGKLQVGAHATQGFGRHQQVGGNV